MEAGGSRLPTVKPDHGTLVPGGSLHGLAYGAVTLCGGVFQPTSATVGGLPGLVAQPGTRNTTSPRACRVGVWFGLSPFRSPLLRGSRLVSLPPPTKMFSFGGFPSGAPDATSCSPVAGGPIRESRVRRLHAPRPGISPLAAPFLGARAEPSTRRRPCRSPGDGARPFGRLGAYTRRSLLGGSKHPLVHVEDMLCSPATPFTREPYGSRVASGTLSFHDY